MMFGCINLGRAALTAPLYISVAWSLIISYQLFTRTAVYTLVSFANMIWPSIGLLLMPRVETIIFIHAFAWIFVLASVVPSIILGKSRSILLQFFLCLTLTLVAVSVEDILRNIMGPQSAFQLNGLSMLFQNFVVAGLYLSAPYIFMLYLDIRSRRQKKDGAPEKAEDTIAGETEQLVIEETAVIEPDQMASASRPEPTEFGADSMVKTCESKPRFLWVTSIICFVLAVTTFLLDTFFLTSVLGQSLRFAYVTMFISLGIILVFLAHRWASLFN